MEKVIECLGIATGRRIRNVTWMWLKVPIKKFDPCLNPLFIPKDSRYTELKQRGKVHRRSKENWLLKKEKNSYTSFTLEMANTKERSEEMSLGVQLCDWKVLYDFFSSFFCSFFHSFLFESDKFRGNNCSFNQNT